MRGWWVAPVLIACTGCHGQVRVPIPRVSVQANATVRAAARVEAAVEAPVPLEGAVVVEFFGIPLEGAQDVVFVLDRSGSMAEPAQGAIAQIGAAEAQTVARAKIEVAHHELVAALERLPDDTRLNVLFFNESLEGFSPSFVVLDPSRKGELADFVTQTTPTGSTALAPALRTAFMMNPRRVVLLSDGLGNVGGDASDVLRDARQAMRGGVRIDTIGLGADQDAELLSALAAESGGLYQAL